MALTQITEKSIKDGEIVNADINASAAIARTKLANVDLIDDTSPQLGGNLDTNSFEIMLDDDHRVYFGDSNDLEIWHSPNNNSYIKNSTGELKIASDNIALMKTDQSETFIDCTGDGAVDLYHNNVKKLSTRSYGIEVHAPEGGEAMIYLTADEGDDTNDLYRFVAQNGGDLVFQRHNGSAYSSELRLKSAGGMQLNYQGSNKFETLSNGIEVHGHIYLADNNQLRLGNVGSGGDLKIYHDETDSYILENGTGVLNIKTNGTSIDLTKTPHENLARFIVDGACELYYDNSKKLETTSSGVTLTGTTTSTNSSHCHQTITDAGSGTSTFVYRGHHSSGSTISFNVWSNGNVQNLNNSYGSLSDIKLKENIVDANSQWNDIKAIKIRNYNFKAETGQDTHTQIGCIAQEVETVSPKLVYESPDINKDTENLGTTTKSINYSILYMKGLKALQEAMTKIEILETKVAALEAA